MGFLWLLKNSSKNLNWIFQADWLIYPYWKKSSSTPTHIINYNLFWSVICRVLIKRPVIVLSCSRGTLCCPLMAARWWPLSTSPATSRISLYWLLWAAGSVARELGGVWVWQPWGWGQWVPRLQARDWMFCWIILHPCVHHHSGI